MGSRLDRRDLLRLGAGVGIGIAGAGFVSAGLTACGTKDIPKVSKPGRNRPPVQIPYAGGQPDLRGSKSGIPAGYFRYPANPPTFVHGQVGNGGAISALMQGVQLVVPKERNHWLKTLDTSLHAELRINSVASASFNEKLQVTLAGGDFPDLVQFVAVPSMPTILAKDFVELTDYIGGDQVKKYPALAALPASAWTAGMINGHLYGIAQPRSMAGRSLTTRADTLERLGVSVDDVSDGRDFLALCKEVTDPAKQRWAFGAWPTAWLVPGILEMMGGPNGWRADGKRLVRDIESDEYAEALETVRRMWSDGLVHPDSFAQPAANGTWWVAGRTVFFYQAFEGWGLYQLAHPEMRIGAMIPPKWTGGGASVKQLGTGNYSAFVAIKKAADKRVEEILRVINYLAVPFGTKEYLEVNYGIPGVDYRLKGSDPIPTSTGTGEKSASIGYIGGTGFTALYQPGDPELVRRQHDYLTRTIPGGMPNPVLGLYSETANTAGVTADKTLLDLQDDIIQGRKPVSAFPAAVRTWRTTVGDKIRGEFEKALAHTK